FLIYLIPMVIFFAGIMQIMEQWIIRTNQFTINAKTNFYQSLITNVSKVSAGLFIPTAAVLVILQAMSQGFRSLLIIILIRKKPYESNNNEEELKSYKQLAKEHKDFPLYRAPE